MHNLETHLIVSFHRNIWTCSWIEGRPPDVKAHGITEAIDPAAGDDPARQALYAVAEAIYFYIRITGYRPASVEIRHASNHARIACRPFFVAYKTRTPPASWTTNDRRAFAALGTFDLSEDILPREDARKLLDVSERAAAESAVYRLSGGVASLALMAG